MSGKGTLCWQHKGAQRMVTNYGWALLKAASDNIKTGHMHMHMQLFVACVCLCSGVACAEMDKCH